MRGGDLAELAGVSVEIILRSRLEKEEGTPLRSRFLHMQNRSSEEKAELLVRELVNRIIEYRLGSF